MSHSIDKAVSKEFVLSRSLVFMMAAAGGIAVANLYYAQPLMEELAQFFKVAPATIGVAAMLIQIGYALGLFFLVPLGDIKERRSLITFMLSVSAIALLLLSCSFNTGFLLVCSLLVGITSITPQLIVPFAAQLASPGERGKVIGTVMSGLLIGILLSRTFSGIVASALGWQSVYRIAVLMMVLLIVLLNMTLPKSAPTSVIGYSKLIKSLWEMLRVYPALRRAALIGATMFATFSAFWTTLAFLLKSPVYNLGAHVAGLFGLIGVAGALAASVVGRVADRQSPRFTLSIAIVLTIAAYIGFWALGYRMWGLIIGVILLDLGVQTGQVSNQIIIYALSAEARNRINAVYMVSYFIGGALGSFLGSLGWGLWGWPGVCAVGIVFQAVAGITHFTAGKH